ncbi:acyl-CoA thioesterase II [soil metagenome]
MSLDALPDTKLAGIADAIALEQLAPHRFRGGTHAGPATRTYGGEVAGQAVLAAGRTVDPARDIHSAHMHFLLPGDTSVPVEFDVEATRDGGSFSSRRVRAIQRDRVIFTMTASFQVPESGLEHQVPEVDVPDPSATPTPEEMFADDPENLRWVNWLTSSIGLEARFPELPARAAAARGLRVPPRQRVWLRAKTPVSDARADQAAALAYVSDILLLSSALGPHELTLQGGRLQFATVDHTIWFHAPVRVDDWFLYDQQSRWAGGGRALCRGEIFDVTGRLCATTMQEGLLRVLGS